MISLFIGKGHTGHERHGPSQNRFQYPMFFLKFRTDSETELMSTMKKIFYNLFSFRADDYLWKKPGSLDENIRSYLKENCQYEAEEIWLVTIPRMFGYAFNPVSFWLCRRQGVLEAALCEVNNTFGERHFYWLAPIEGQKLEGWRRAEKQFHVSPFFPVEGFYKFHFTDNSERTRIDINYYDAKEKLTLSTWLEGQISPLHQESLSVILLSYGWMTVLVVARIHYQALKLWFKGATFFRKPAPPQKEITR